MVVPEILSALITVFRADGELDLPGQQRLCQRLEPFVDGVFVAGTTGEFLALEPAEHAAIVETALSVFGPQRVVVHVGAPSTRQALALTRTARHLGAIRFAALTPYYLPASPTGIARHWAAIADQCGGALYGYLFPEVAVTDLTPQDLGQVVSCGIAGLKVSGAASKRVAAYLEAAPEGFKLWSGNDADLPQVMAAGGVGTVSGVSGVCPWPWAAYRDAVHRLDETAQATAQAIIEQIVPVLGPSIANLKTGLELLKEPSGACRMSIDAPAQDTRDRIAAAVCLANNPEGE